MVDHKNAGSETLIHFLLSKLISSCTHESRVPVSDFASKKRDEITSNELIFEGRKRTWNLEWGLGDRRR